MTLQTYAGITKPLINSRGYVSFCVCCCENLPFTLYLHVIPTYRVTAGGSYQSDCEEQDKGTADVVAAGSWQAQGFIGKNCDDWKVDTVQAQPSLQCDDPTGGPPLDFSIAALLYCAQVNTFKMDLCIGMLSPADPGFPDSADTCDELYLELTPNIVNACSAQPGDMYVEFPPITPGDLFQHQPGGTTWCNCSFTFIWTEDSVFIPEKRPFFAFMGKGAAGLPNNVGANLRFAEAAIGVGALPTGLDEYF